MDMIRGHESTKPAATGLASGAAVLHALLIACGILSVSAWLLLRRWYSLGTYYATPGFALDKIPGHFDAPLLRQTAVLFVVLTVVYGVGFWIIRTAPSISRAMKLVVAGQVLLSGLANILIYPVAAIDLFNYLAQFKLVFYYHRNPYVETFLPTFDADPLARLAWPLHTPPPYGPAWLLFGGLPAWLAGLGDLLPPLIAYKTWSFV
ncbi:MAG TPA: hypothetical protein VLA19_07420, partial [Herpetosiphonaceae bacterium]|nr:hypothetical protein [Herpetosiphonaceae bacterium]